MLRLALLGLTCLGVAISCTGQLTIDWQRNYGGSSGESAHQIVTTDDGGYLVLGRTNSNSDQVLGHHGMDDLWVIRLDGLGNLLWQRCLGGSSMEIPGSIQSTSDGGCFILGTTASEDGDPPPSLGSSDIWLIKMDVTGDIVWQTRYGGAGSDEGRSILQSMNGELLLFCQTNSPVFDLHHGGSDLLIIHVDENGAVIAERCYGGMSNDVSSTFAQSTGAPITTSGHVRSTNGDVQCEPTEPDIWAVRIGSDLGIEWSLCLGGSSLENAKDVLTTASGDTFLAMISHSSDGDVSSNNGEADYWLVHLSSTGDLLHEAAYGGSDNDFPRALIRGSNGEIYVCGLSYSSDGDITQALGGTDLWLLRLNEALELQWQMSVGGSAGDFGHSMCFAPDGGLVVAGVTASIDGGIPSLFGGPDLWVVKFNPEDVGIEEALDPDRLITYPTPTSTELFVTWKEFQAERLEVIDHLGRVCITVPAAGSRGTLAVPMASLASGLYVLQLTGPGGMRTARTIKH